MADPQESGRAEREVPEPSPYGGRSPVFLHLVVVGVTLCLSAGLAYVLQPTGALLGWLAGAGWGLVVCFVSFALSRRVAYEEGFRLQAAMMLSAGVGFLLVLIGVLAFVVIWPQIAATAALTSLALYLSLRMSEVVAARQRAILRRPRGGGSRSTTGSDGASA